MANKRITPNRYKPTADHGKGKGNDTVHHGRPTFKVLTWIFVVAMMSLGAIYTHDVVVQCPFFRVQDIQITGLNRVSRDSLLAEVGLNRPVNLFELHLPTLEKKLSHNPWVSQARVSRKPFSTLIVKIEEQTPLAIVSIHNLADVIINTEGIPFKEYIPETDKLEGLPVITGVDLSMSDTTYSFQGDLFNAIMNLLKLRGIGGIKTIHGDKGIGLTVDAKDIYNTTHEEEAKALIPIKLGFDRFEEKLARARFISQYMEARFPSKIILAMDLYDVKKIFIKTKDALHNTLEKGA